MLFNYMLVIILWESIVKVFVKINVLVMFIIV